MGGGAYCDAEISEKGLCSHHNTPLKKKYLFDADLVMTIMVLKLEGNPKIGSYVWNDHGYLIWIRHLFRLKTVTNLNYLF